MSFELSMTDDNNMGNFNLEKYLPELIKCLEREDCPEIMSKILKKLFLFKFFIFFSIKLIKKLMDLHH